MYVRKGLNAVPVPLEGQMEAICVELHLPSRKNVYVLAVYRAPSGGASLPDFVSDLDSVLANLNLISPKHLTCVVGDFNAKSSTWWSGQSSNDSGTALSALMVDYGLVQLVEGPTRSSTESSASQLDLMFANDLSVVESCSVLPPVADHCPTILQFRVNFIIRSRQCRKLWDYKNADFAGLNNFLTSVDWSTVCESADASHALSLWENIVLSSLEAFIPRKIHSPQPQNKPWYSSYLCRLRRQRSRLFHRSKSLDKNHHLSIAYRKIRNLYVAELRSAERSFYVKQGAFLSSNKLMRDSHRWWKTAKSACGMNSSDTIPPLSWRGKIQVRARDKAECLNSIFAVQCSAPPSASGSRSVKASTVEQNFSFDHISSSAVYKRLSALNVWKASGLDGIGNRLLRECASAFAFPLAHIFNCSIKSGLYPSQWKRGVVKPLYKHKGDRSNPSFYRPVVLLPCVSKVFEGHVREQLQAHCLKAHAIPDEQFGFLPKRSTVWQLLSVLDDWERDLDDGSCVHACFLDMAKAFDRVDHLLLLQKLESVGVHAINLSWFRSYLSQRSICTDVDGHHSSFRSISSGVPQGSVLGPLLFILFYRDLPCVISAPSAMFADDTLLYDRCSGADKSQPCCRLQKDLTNLST